MDSDMIAHQRRRRRRAYSACRNPRKGGIQDAFVGFRVIQNQNNQQIGDQIRQINQPHQLHDHVRIQSIHHDQSTENGHFTNMLTLFHQTDLECAEKIISSQVMKPGKSGLFGAGIYFANTIEATDHKALRRGVYLIADVYLGNMIEISKKKAKSKKVDTKKLQIQGYNSIFGRQLKSGREYIAFNSNQVKNIKFVYGQRPQAFFRPHSNKIVLFFATSCKSAQQIVESQNMIKSDGDFGRAYYMYESLSDALEDQSEQETYLMADVTMENCCNLGNEIVSIYKKPFRCKTFIGKIGRMPIYIIKYKNLITRIHYCGGRPWEKE